MMLVWIGTLWLWPGSNAPTGWALCNGAKLPVEQNDVLFSVIGGSETTKDGVTYFTLPTITAPTGFTWIIATEGEYPSDG